MLLKCEITGNILKCFSCSFKITDDFTVNEIKNLLISASLSHVATSLHYGVEIIIVKYDLNVVGY